MFIVTDLTGKTPYVTGINDVKDVRDVVIGITGESRVGDDVLGIVSHMRFGDEFICRLRFKVKCILDVETFGASGAIEASFQRNLHERIGAKS